MKQIKKIKAFTLIEIMVATVIMVILSGLLIQISNEVLKLWNRSSGKLSALSEARMAMDIIASDLESMVMRNDGLEWFRAENDVLKKPAKSGTVALRFFSIVNDDLGADEGKSRGNISAIAYNLDYVNPVDGSYKGDKTFVLYRMEVDPESTFLNLLKDENRSRLPNKRSQSWGTAHSIKGDKGENYLVSNIVDFAIEFHVEDDGERNTPTLYYERSIKNPRRSVIYGGDEATIGPQANYEHYQKPLAFADIKLTVLSDEGIEIMRNIEKRPETPEDIIRLHSDIFIRRIYFKVRPF
ncbi:MAG: hypothetical protein CML08_00165 [Puniceicoccaceae bacterium]|nr:hypothetical protein [Puniceicoccaceae bacterium]|tara:strand:- start:1659 stop:2549 length:891 start_codon:yes stop_codon:yes gene_type:complete